MSDAPKRIYVAPYLIGPLVHTERKVWDDAEYRRADLARLPDALVRDIRNAIQAPVRHSAGVETVESAQNAALLAVLAWHEQQGGLE